MARRSKASQALDEGEGVREEEEWEDEESILIDLGHQPTNCQWMLTQNEIIIK